MTIYEELVKRVSEGEDFHIDFEKRSMKVGKQYLIKDGEYDTERELYMETHAFPNINVILFELDQLYYWYKYSLPSERSDSKRRKYFKALPIEEIPDRELLRAERREVAQAKLEGAIVCLIVSGQLIWNKTVMGNWFYQSPNDKDFVLLKQWIETKQI
jgi:predicted SprT family Zn-dependent metalloprotease